ncbi:PREDICTED: NADH dehydrogenase [ubiquinone] 1 beta subcomplex subunit 2, mitochondrial [Chinchilla lanigera]|uniref:NADH dehydrogenase [ubiquinone] 1 beta subcomplex subunit 2, mitochondrial n=1 Tax=Chinchilla lanigera TaxID=34839 RepID=A0A8C2UML2_CHILA|nr:PREDICTED: NADH dehydrogenase [ubiquinone] 1 beta subcomplex subunit 2, mitochondrial [Chinchilla lanigera]XP_005405478.2 PREDICTED: NADH dehydrogenase [ubiquinone] 1 beta subcomplex subunit 2, mitochondrial [Chinchilla lanigera]
MSALTRLVPLARVGGRLFRSGRARAAGGGAVRHAGGDAHAGPCYRQFPQPSRKAVIQAEVLSATMWFWILWRFWHDSDAVLGHFPYPDPSQWTDEELGILPDDED